MLIDVVCEDAEHASVSVELTNVHFCVQPQAQRCWIPFTRGGDDWLGLRQGNANDPFHLPDGSYKLLGCTVIISLWMFSLLIITTHGK